MLGLKIRKYAAEHTNEAIVAYHSWGLTAAFSISALAFLWRIFSRHLSDHNLRTSVLVVCLSIFFAIIWYENNRFCFDLTRKQIRWVTVRGFVRRTGVIDFKDVSRVYVSEFRRADKRPATYRIVFDLNGGEFPLTRCYSTGFARAKFLCDQIQEMVQA